MMRMKMRRRLRRMTTPRTMTTTPTETTDDRTETEKGQGQSRRTSKQGGSCVSQVPHRRPNPPRGLLGPGVSHLPSALSLQRAQDGEG
eukprot:6134691-Pyramimonas_sp.AAC.1